MTSLSIYARPSALMEWNTQLGGNLKHFTFIIIVFSIILSCASRNIPLTVETSVDEKQVEVDTTSNYHLFDQIEKLRAEDYYEALDSVKKGLTNDFFTLRMAYTKTKDFTPYDVKLSEVHKSIVNSIKSSKYDEALALADSIFQYNYVDPKMHLYCGHIYRQLNDTAKSNYHYSCYEGLINSIIQSGDGRSAETAFIVITTDEEYAVLNWYRLKLIEQSLINIDGHTFDLIQVEDEKANAEYEIYFNIDIPFGSLGKALGID
jgi:hypothetical protein